MKKTKVYIDVFYYKTALSGIKTYIEELVKGFDKYGRKDVEYIFSHKCFNKSDGKPYKENYYDGSKFIIKEGVVSNNQDGAGKYSVFEDSRVDKNGKITVKGKRASKNFNIIGIVGRRINKKKYFSDKFEISNFFLNTNNLIKFQKLLKLN